MANFDKQTNIFFIYGFISLASKLLGIVPPNSPYSYCQTQIKTRLSLVSTHCPSEDFDRFDIFSRKAN